MKTITLTRGKVTTVDDSDFEWLSQFRWSAVKGRGDSYYASRMAKIILPDGGVRLTCRQMQRDILDPNMKLPRSIKVDHRNGDTLDNVRSNLRLSTDTGSNANRGVFKNNLTGYKGVHLHVTPKRGVRYLVTVKFNGRVYYGKPQDDPVSGAKEYNRLALKFFGEFARLNVIPGEEP